MVIRKFRRFPEMVLPIPPFTKGGVQFPPLQKGVRGDWLPSAITVSALNPSAPFAKRVNFLGIRLIETSKSDNAFDRAAKNYYSRGGNASLRCRAPSVWVTVGRCHVGRRYRPFYPGGLIARIGRSLAFALLCGIAPLLG